MDPSDLDQGGAERRFGQFWLGPSQGWTQGSYGVMRITSAGTYAIPLGITEIYVDLPPPPFATWGPGTTEFVTLTNARLTATNTASSGVQGVQATAGAATGKFYFEVTVTHAPTTPVIKTYEFGVGAVGTANYANIANGFVGGAGTESPGRIYSNGSANSPPGGSALNLSNGMHTNDVFGIAVDLDNRKFSAICAAGPDFPTHLYWNGNEGGVIPNDPPALVGGATIPAGTMIPSAVFNENGIGDAMTFNFGASSAVTFDPATALHASLSGGNLVATGIAPANGHANVFISEGHTTGKYYFEITWATMGGFLNGGEIGIATTTATNFDIISHAADTVQLTQGNFFDGAPIWSGGVETGFRLGGTGLLGPYLAAGFVIGIAVDLDNRTAWFKVASPSFLGNFWNGVSTANPATNTGGVSVPAGTIIPVVGWGLNLDVYEANFGLTAFVGAVPSGFTAGWTAGSVPFQFAVPFGFASGWGTTGSAFSEDPDWANVVFLCGFEASDFDESTTNNKGIATVVSGSGGPVASNVIAPAIGKYSCITGAFFGLTWANSTDWQFGTGHFTVELWIRINSPQFSAPNQIIGQWSGASNRGWRIVCDTGNVIKWQVTTDGATILTDLTSGALSTSAWHAVAVDYDGTTYRLYIDGVMAASSTAARSIFASTSVFAIGDPSGAVTAFEGFYDEVRVTKGVARYASNSGYAPLLGPFPRWIIPVTTPVTLDPATAVKVTLSNGNLTVTNAQSATPEQGVKVTLASAKSSGKYYFEISMDNAADNDSTFGVGTTTATYTSLLTDGTGGVVAYNNGVMWTNGSNSFIFFNGYTTGDLMGVAVDLDNRSLWVSNISGPDAPLAFNSGAPTDPTNNINGVPIPAGSMVPFATFGGSVGDVPGNVFTANFGENPFTGTVPSGFTPGWPR